MTDQTKRDQEAEIREYKRLHDLYYHTPTPTSEFDVDRYHELRKKFEGVDCLLILLDAIAHERARTQRLRSAVEKALREDNGGEKSWQEILTEALKEGGGE